MKLASFVPSSSLVVALCLTAWVTTQAAPVVIDSAIRPSTGHLYYLLDNSDWLAAESAAVALGGHLVTINDQAEQDWVFNLWGTGRSLWIGLTDAAAEGVFVWTSGEPVTYTNWRVATQEPNDGVGWGRPSEDYVYMYAPGFSEFPGEWNDYTSQLAPDGGLEPAFFGVVEIVPEPTAPCLFLLGGLCLVIAKRWRINRSEKP